MTCFEFTNNNDQVILGQISEVKMGQCVLFNRLKSLFRTNESSGSGIQESTPCGPEGTGIWLVYKYARNHAQLLFVIFYCHEFY